MNRAATTKRRRPILAIPAATILIVWSTAAPAQTPCIGGSWRNLDTGAPAAAGLGLREPPVAVVYGTERRDGQVVLPRCAALDGPVRIAVLMVDWHDFDPRVNPSNENNASSTFPAYVASTPAQLQAFLQSEVSPYFSDVSGGRATVSFDVVGWTRSDTPGAYLKPRAQYLYNLHDLNASYPDPTWQCRTTDIFLDALRDAVVQAGLDVSRYDLDANGLVDGMVFVYEGKGGLCSGGNLSWVNAGYSPNPPAFQWQSARALVGPDDPNAPVFRAQRGWVHLYNNIPERVGDAGNNFYYSATWVHELGHLLLGYPDYYYPRFNLGSWVLSGNHGELPTHPAAFEKWLFGRWLTPTVITASGDYTVTANEIPDGASHGGGPHLLQVPIDDDPGRFLTIEGRWFDADGNHGSRWAQANQRESGLLIVEFDLTREWHSSAPQVYRHAPARAGDTLATELRAYRPGDRFSRCYATRCVTIEPTSAPGATFSLSVEIAPVPWNYELGGRMPSLPLPSTGDSVIGSDRWQQVERLYHDALARADRERAAFLRDACGEDEALRHEVESLLAYEGDTERFMAAPAIDVAAAAFTPSESTATSLAGRRLGPYEIGSLLGAGGMGEVYRARDTKLERDVAIKILPHIFTDDAERRARFEREARLLATLNHPHIGAIYGFEDREDIHGLVLELVEGETLAVRLARGALPIAEALAVARQIAEALDAAHGKGIVHRDLKPGNIAITPDGVVKVLDFGLAKAAAAGAAGDDLSHAPTITVSGTQAGTMLGTAAYMSPEQARGRSVDKRTDIWAFGCVLYQMLTGRKPFPGDTVSDTMVAILDREPNWPALPDATPSRIRRLLRRCLEKDPKHRLRDIGDALVELDDSEPERASSSKAGWRETAAWSAAAVCLLGALAAAGYALSRAPARPGIARFHVLLPEEGSISSVALSADGRRLAYVGTGPDGRRRVWVRPVDSLQTQMLAGTEGAAWPFWSPDGRFIAFFAQGKLRKIPSGGGASQVISDAEGGTGATSSGTGGTWSQAGTILFSPDPGGGLYRVSADGGKPAQVTTPREGQGGHRFPQFLPDGRRFLFLAPGGQRVPSGVYVGSLDSGETDLLLETGVRAHYAPPGYLLFVRSNALMAQAFDVSATRLSGAVMSIAEDVAYDAGGGSADFAVADGLLVYRQRERNVRELVWLDRNGQHVREAGSPADYIHPWLSPDEKRAVVEVADPDTGAHAVWMLDLVRGSRSRFVAGPGASHFPVWSADGRRILFSSDRNGPWSLFARAATGTGADEELLRLPAASTPTDWSRDGRFVIYQTSAPPTRADIWALPVAPPGRPFAVAATAAAERQAQLSPDGRWIAYVSDDSGRDEVLVHAFPEATDRWPVSSISNGGGSQPQWRRDGRELFYLSTDLTLMAVDVNATASSFDAGVPRTLFAVKDLRAGEISARNNFMPSADGKRFLMNRLVPGQGSRRIAVVLDWTAVVLR